MRYRTIVADPPWRYETPGAFRPRKRGSGLPYESMAFDDILALPVCELAEDNAHLYVWTTNTHIQSAYTLAEEWGFRPRNLLTWCKPPKGLIGYGTFSQSSEFVLFSSRGHYAGERCETTWFQWPRSIHSRKPDAFLDLVERVSRGPYLEMFARRQRLGWDTWGNEALEHVEMGA